MPCETTIHTLFYKYKYFYTHLLQGDLTDKTQQNETTHLSRQSPQNKSIFRAITYSTENESTPR